MILKIQAAAGAARLGEASSASAEATIRTRGGGLRLDVAAPDPKERPLTPEEEEALDVAGLTPEEKAAVAKMQASARDLLLRGEATPEGFPGELSPAEAAAVAKIQASAKLHLARSDAVDAALNESASVEVNAAAVRDDASTRRLQATARAHLEMRGAAVVEVDAAGVPSNIVERAASVDAPPAVADADADADVDLDVAALDLDSKEKVVTMQASARAHVERVRSAAASAADELAKDPTAAATRLAARPSRRASRRGGGLMRRDSFKRLELEGVVGADAGAEGAARVRRRPILPRRGDRRFVLRG